jgi:Domain of unknown function (DUF4124)
MNRAFIPALAASALALALAAPASAWQQVYKWKDANGVTHYSQNPPPAGKFESRTIVNRQPTATQGTQAGDKSVEPVECVRARNNIALINSGVALKVDSDNDGKPDRDINESERKRQLDINQIVLRANCSAPASGQKNGKSEDQPPPPPNTNAF